MNGLLDTFTAKFLGPLYFSKLNIFFRLSVGGRDPSILSRLLFKFILQLLKLLIPKPVTTVKLKQYMIETW